jgi:hypothetical protein
MTKSSCGLLPQRGNAFTDVAFGSLLGFDPECPAATFTVGALFLTLRPRLSRRHPCSGGDRLTRLGTRRRRWSAGAGSRDLGRSHRPHLLPGVEPGTWCPHVGGGHWRSGAAASASGTASLLGPSRSLDTSMSRRRHSHFLDAAAPALLAAQSIGRVGNYFNQELFGARPTPRGRLRSNRHIGRWAASTTRPSTRRSSKSSYGTSDWPAGSFCWVTTAGYAPVGCSCLLRRRLLGLSESSRTPTYRSRPRRSTVRRLRLPELRRRTADRDRLVAGRSRSRSTGVLRFASRLPFAYPVPDGFGEADLKLDAVLPHRGCELTVDWKDIGPRILEPSLSSCPLCLLARFNVLRVGSNPCRQRIGKSATGEMTERLFATMEPRVPCRRCPRNERAASTASTYTERRLRERPLEVGMINPVSSAAVKPKVNRNLLGGAQHQRGGALRGGAELGASRWRASSGLPEGPLRVGVEVCPGGRRSLATATEDSARTRSEHSWRAGEAPARSEIAIPKIRHLQDERRALAGVNPQFAGNSDRNGQS